MNTYIRIWRQLEGGRRKQCLGLLVVMFVVAISEVVSIGAVLPFLGLLTNPSLIINSSHYHLLPIWMRALEINQLLICFTIAFGLIALFSGFMRLILIWAQTRLSYGVGVDFSVKIYKNSLYQSYEEQISFNSSEIIGAITNKSNLVVSHALYPVLNICSSVLMLVMIVSMLAYIDYRLASLIFAGFSCVYILVMAISKKYLESDSALVSAEQTKVFKLIQEGLGGLRDIIITGSQDFYIDSYKRVEIPLRRAMGNIQIASVSPRFIIEAIAMSLIAGIAMFYVANGDSVAAIVPILGALALGAQRILPLLQQSFGSWAAIKGGNHSVEDALIMLERSSNNQADHYLNGESKIEFKHQITLHKVGFEYALSGKGLVLQEIDLSIQKGSCIGIIGQTGSGKTTLVDIIMGLLCPTQGLITVDDVPLTSKNMRGWQNRIAHVPQNIFLADASIAQNILFGSKDSDIDYQRLRLACHKAQMLETIESWPNKFNTMIGERGIRLSGGQRQRIGIARALYRNADVIILDEATSALDISTESAFMSEMNRSEGKTTVIMVAHRLISLKGCDKIIEVNFGKIARVGSYQEIIGNTA